MQDKDKKSRWDYLGKEPEIEEEIVSIQPEEYPRPEDYPKDSLQRIYENLPEDLQQALFSEEVAEIVGEMSIKYKIPDYINKLVELVGYVMLGIFPVGEFKNRLKKDLGLSPEVLESLIQEVDELILDPIRESLDQLYKGRTDYARQG